MMLLKKNMIEKPFARTDIQTLCPPTARPLDNRGSPTMFLFQRFTVFSRTVKAGRFQRIADDLPSAIVIFSFY